MEEKVLAEWEKDGRALARLQPHGTTLLYVMLASQLRIRFSLEHFPIWKKRRGAWGVAKREPPSLFLSW